MFLERIRIRNFKSLKDVEVCPSGLTGLVGPNNAGKTNFVMAMKFLAEVHQHGLETAIVRAGGMENIALRKMRRSKSPVAFEVEVRAGPRDPLAVGLSGWEDLRGLRISHRFSFKASGTAIRADFSVVEETFTVSGPGEGDLYDHGESFLETTRGSDGHARLEARGSLADSQDYRRLEARLGCPSRADGKRVPELGEQELLLDSSYARTRLTWLFSQFFAQMGIHHFSADMVRASGTPTPNPVLSLPGGNLPALVDWLQRKRKNDWARILDGMRDIIPGLEDIKVDILPSKTLGIFFAEKGFGRPWRIDEVSDGTVHVLSILVALADPRVSAVVIDEPESSLHPWVIKQLGKRLRGLAKRKTVILTTQSPVVVDLLQPSETWVVSRRSGKTSIARLTDLDPRIEEDWRAGDVGLSEFLDAGLVPRAVPGGGDL